MRVLALHADVIVAISRVWQTTCTTVRGPGGEAREAFVIDSPVYPDELEVLPAVLEQSGFPFSGLLATHADWDHLLGRLAFPSGALGGAETTAARLRATPGQAQRQLRDFDERHYLSRPAPLSLGQVQALPVPGHCALGGDELELHPATGHTEDGMAVWIPWAQTLVCGDYLSPVEIPIISEGGSVSAYQATLAALEPLVAAAEHIVPGHGPPLASGSALKLLHAHAAYVGELEGDPQRAKPPAGLRGAHQRRLHEANVARAMSIA